MSVSIRDTDSFHGHLRDVYGFAHNQTVVLAQSMAAVIASAWVLDYAPDLRCLILASPAFSVRLYVPFALPLMRLWRRLHGEFFVNSYVKARLLTRTIRSAGAVLPPIPSSNAPLRPRPYWS